MTTLPITAPVETPTSAREARADRFLSRVAALSPAQWGELDAIAQRLAASDPISWWRRSRQMAAFGSRAPLLEDAMHVFGFVLFGVGDMIDGVLRLGRPARTRPAKYVRRHAPDASAESRALTDRMETLHDVAASQPGGVGASLELLVGALMALWLRDEVLTPGGFARAYAPIERVIPAASL